MRKVIVGVALAGYVTCAAAAGVDELDARDVDTGAYSARAYYRLEFGGPVARSQSVGLRFDNGLTSRRDTPALLQVSLDSSGVSTLSLRGLQLGGPALAASEDDSDASNRKGFWARLSTGEWIALGFSAIVLAATVGQAASGGGGGVSGTGGS